MKSFAFFVALFASAHHAEAGWTRSKAVELPEATFGSRFTSIKEEADRFTTACREVLNGEGPTLTIEVSDHTLQDGVGEGKNWGSSCRGSCLFWRKPQARENVCVGFSEQATPIDAIVSCSARGVRARVLPCGCCSSIECAPEYVVDSSFLPHPHGKVHTHAHVEENGFFFFFPTSVRDRSIFSLFSISFSLSCARVAPLNIEYVRNRTGVQRQAFPHVYARRFIVQTCPQE